MLLLRKFPCLSTMRNCRRALCCVVVWSIVILVSIDVSTATWSPHLHPKETHHHSYSQDQNSGNQNGCQQPNSNYMNADALRGGSTILQPPPPPPPLQQHQESEMLQHQHHHRQNPPDHHKEAPSFIPKIKLKHVANALLHTCEWNRRLLQGLKHWGGRHRSSSQSHQYIEDQKQQLHSNTNVHDSQQNKYGNLPVNVHPSRAWQPPIQALSGRLLEEEELSLFHAKIPRSQSSSSSDLDEIGEDMVRYWGPDLLPYLEHIVDLLGMDKNGVEISLAMIYMDRACSVETPRSNGVPSCPFCSPRTVHRLSLSALMISIQAVRGEPQHLGMTEDEYYTRLSLSLGIPLLQLQQMVEWMRAALGDDGLYVTLEEMRTWSRSLEAIFSSSSSSQTQ